SRKAVSRSNPNPSNQKRALESPEKVQAIRTVLWSLWPPSLRNAGKINDFNQFSNLTLPIDQIDVPTLIIHGTEDVNVEFSHGKLLADTIPNAQFYIIKGGDHMMPFTHKEEVNKIISEFVQNVSVQDKNM
ncbi:MAG: alpha/beta hydrolase, partial [Pseudomonadota bacterium]